ncbi:hypothetical protein CAEBREN_23256 [Caenorhabditis brenneri]|uniref:Uncharacterized protein n=1 Tax=Caenorhabditis brenneri TaxID=135651 RepID=G0N7E7_CAEBE|nr:hypothetical protein CAEBREN_23256 [Caenorhabditis brenneri]
MKLLINCVLICGILTVWVSAKPAPSDRIKLFMEALNKDREEMGVKIGTPIRKLIYDANLEANILDILESRNDEVLMVLKKNDVAKKTNDNSKITSEAKNLESLYFFAPDAKTIGCSITLTVSDEEEIVEYFGGCIFGEKVNIEEFEEKLIKAGLPPVSKYADLLGVEPEGSGAGTATSNEIRAKRDLSPDVRNKLIEVLNKDRQEIGKKLNIKMEIMKYNVSLERSIVWSEDDCMKSPSWFGGQHLNGNSVAREVMEEHKKNYTFRFFIPSYKTIGCSKDFKCSVTVYREVRDEVIGKTMVLRGLCIFGEAYEISKEDNDKINEADRPMPWKYGDIIGVEGSSPPEESAKDQGLVSGEAPPGKGSAAGTATSNEIRAKRDLSPDVRNKLIEVLNKDRQEIGKKLNISMEIMKYNVSLERSIVWSEDDCMKTPSFTGLSTISGDSLAREVIEKYTQGYGFFIPSYKTIGCSKDFKCKDTFDSTVIDKSMIGKNAVYRGFCIFGEEWKISDEDNIKLHEAERPLPFKYAAIIGVDGPSPPEGSAKDQGSGSGTSGPSGKGSGAESVFSLFMSLFLVFYI